MRIEAWTPSQVGDEDTDRTWAVTGHRFELIDWVTSHLPVESVWQLLSYWLPLLSVKRTFTVAFLTAAPVVLRTIVTRTLA